MDSLDDLGNVLPVDLHRQGFRLEALTATGLARLGGLEAGELFAHPAAVGLAPAAFEIGDDPLEGLRVSNFRSPSS